MDGWMADAEEDDDVDGWMDGADEYPLLMK